jgi:putative ABC transport system permease protein
VNVSPGYFETLRITMVKGRPFTDGDRMGGAPVVIIDETLARRFFPQGDAVGKGLRLGATIGADTSRREIIGIAASVRSTSPEREPDPTIYVPYAQNPWPTMSLVVLTTGEPARLTNAVIDELRGLDPNQPVYSIRSLDQVVARTLASRRLQTLLMIGFAAAGFLIAIVGVYGMLAYAVVQRTRELGIRVALGAQRHEIIRHCLRRALPPVMVGLLAGLAAALTAAQLLRTLLFGVDPWDPVTFFGAPLLLASAALGACYLPARRAGNLSPLTALRHD